MEPNNETVERGVLAHLMRFFADRFNSVAESLLVVAGTFVFATAVSAGMLVLRVATVYCAGGWIQCSWCHADIWFDA